MVIKFWKFNDSIINNNYLKLDKGLSINAIIELSKDIIDFSHMFEKCPLLEITNWNLDTSNVCDICSMLNHCDLINSIEPIKYWDTSKVEFMCHLFQGCKSLYIYLILQNENHQIGECISMKNRKIAKYISLEYF